MSNDTLLETETALLTNSPSDSINPSQYKYTIFVLQAQLKDNQIHLFILPDSKFSENIQC